MKKTLALLSVAWLAGCRYTVHGEGPRDYEPRYEDGYGDERSPAPMPSSSSSSGIEMPATGSASSSEGDASAAPAYRCEGFPVECSSLSGTTCEAQRGCTESLSDGTCYGAPTPCDWLTTSTACETQSGCTWSAPPRQPPR